MVINFTQLTAQHILIWNKLVIRMLFTIQEIQKNHLVEKCYYIKGIGENFFLKDIIPYFIFDNFQFNKLLLITLQWKFTQNRRNGNLNYYMCNWMFLQSISASKYSFCFKLLIIILFKGMCYQYSIRKGNFKHDTIWEIKWLKNL